MNDNYLWDRTGEPDSEVQELEELLGTLRYQPRPLEIPASLSVRRTRPFVPLAIAAAIALLMIGAGLFIHFQNSSRTPMEQAGRDRQLSPRETAPVPQESIAALPLNQQVATLAPERKPSNQNTARTFHRQPQFVPAKLTEQELAQKEQVLIALRLVSAKLNLAQRKAQSLPQPNAFRNQHKIG